MTRRYQQNNFHRNAIHFQESKIKTESIIKKKQVCDDDTTHDDVRYTIESKFEEDSTRVMSHTEGAGTFVVVTSETPYDSVMPISDFTHNIRNFPERKS
jgi:hypothetical protein